MAYTSQGALSFILLTFYQTTWIFGEELVEIYILESQGGNKKRTRMGYRFQVQRYLWHMTKHFKAVLLYKVYHFGSNEATNSYLKKFFELKKYHI